MDANELVPTKDEAEALEPAPEAKALSLDEAREARNTAIQEHKQALQDYETAAAQVSAKHIEMQVAHNNLLTIARDSYNEVMRDKRTEAELECTTWDGKCNCASMFEGFDPKYAHKQREAQPWCAVHQRAHADNEGAACQTITLQQFVDRHTKP
jgi:hypothetical protein